MNPKEPELTVFELVVVMEKNETSLLIKCRVAFLGLKYLAGRAKVNQLFPNAECSFQKLDDTHLLYAHPFNLHAK